MAEKAKSTQTTTKKAAPKKAASKPTKKADATSEKKTTPQSKTTTKEKSSTFAVVETGGKQYLVREGDFIKVELLSDLSEGDSVTFDSVILTDDGKATNIGEGFLKGAKVVGTVEEIGRDKKISVTRFRAKSRYHRTYGHRQPYMKVRITSVK